MIRSMSRGARSVLTMVVLVAFAFTLYGVAQAAVVTVATNGKTIPQPVPTRWLIHRSTALRRAPAAVVPTNQTRAGQMPTVASRPRAQLAMIR